MRKARILIVDDAITSRRLLSRVVERQADLELAGTSIHGSMAVEKATQVSPDLVILGEEANEGRLLETLDALRLSWTTLPILITSHVAKRGAPLTLDALSRGASSYLAIPISAPSFDEAAVEGISRELLPKLRALLGFSRESDAHVPPPPSSRTEASGSASSRRAVDLVVIGISTGGPNLLGEVLAELPAEFPVPILIVQHTLPTFVAPLAERLDARCRISVRQAVAGDVPKAGTAYFAPSERHMALKRDGDSVRIVLNDGPPENSCRPAADVLFRSAAAVYQNRVLAVVMTGMGSDGLKGCREIRHQGGSVIVQDQATSVVWGMPRQVAEAGLADEILPYDQIAGALSRRVQPGSRSSAGR